MDKLDRSEMECLRKVAEGRHSMEPCPAHVIDRLIRMGLIEHSSLIRYPLECLHATYRLTPAGRAVLARG